MKRTLLALVFVIAVAAPMNADSPTMSVTFIDGGKESRGSETCQK